MVFDPAIPQPNDVISTSQPELLENFTQINTVFGVNHVPFDDASANKGKHKWVTLVEQATAPTSQDNEYLVYSKEVKYPSGPDQAEIFVKPEKNATEYQFTKQGNVFTGLLPVVAVNFDGAGAIQGTALGATTVTVLGSGKYQVNFPALPDNNYFWSVSGFQNSAPPVISQVDNTVPYINAVTTTFLRVRFFQTDSTAVTPLRATVIIWRFQ
jgi:hypothetical protein